MATKTKTTNDEQVVPWERQPGETIKQFEAFCVYRDLGTRRSVSETARRLQKSRQLVARWDERNEWADRVRKYDSHMDAEARKEMEQMAREAKRRRIISAGWMQTEALRQLRSLAAKGESIPASVLVRMVEVGALNERLEFGETTARHEVQVPGEGGVDEVSRLVAAIIGDRPAIETAVEGVIEQGAADPAGNPDGAQ